MTGDIEAGESLLEVIDHSSGESLEEGGRTGGQEGTQRAHNATTERSAQAGGIVTASAGGGPKARTHYSEQAGARAGTGKRAENT